MGSPHRNNAFLESLVGAFLKRCADRVEEMEIVVAVVTVREKITEQHYQLQCRKSENLVLFVYIITSAKSKKIITTSRILNVSITKVIHKFITVAICHEILLFKEGSISTVSC